MKKIRQPIVSVLGHVDHGKTTLLDRIRKTTVAAKEAGHITQHIGATEIPKDLISKLCRGLVEEDKIQIPGLLFIDTPGHEAFTTLRKRGGSLADLAVLVIDITEGVKEQTKESLFFFKEFKTPFIIAANKIDKISGWNSEYICSPFKQQTGWVKEDFNNKIYNLMGQLSEENIISDRFDRIKDFRKNVAIVPVSGKTGEGIPELLSVLIGLSQQFLKEKLELKEDEGSGNILEVKEIEGLGTTADAILYDGQIKKGDYLAIGGKEPVTSRAKALLKPKPLSEIRAEKKFNHLENVEAATGVKIAGPGLDKVIPGSPFKSFRDENKKKGYIKEVQKEIEDIEIDKEKEGVIVKADTLGSLEGLIKILQDKNIPIRKAKIGDVTKKDLLEAKGMKEEFDRVVFSFNVKILPERIEGIKIFESSVIYQLVEGYEEWVKERKVEKEKEKLEKLTRPGKIKILPGFVFRASKPVIVGVDVLEGVVKPGYDLVKKGKIIGKISEIQKEGSSVKEAEKGDRVAVSIEGPTLGRQIDKNDVLYNAISKSMLKELEKNIHLLSESEKEVLEEVKEGVKQGSENK